MGGFVMAHEALSAVGAVLLILIAVVDLRTRTVPVALSGAVAAVGFARSATIAGGGGVIQAMGMALLAGLLVAVCLAATRVVARRIGRSPDPLGAGDVDLGFATGVFVGIQGWATLLLLTGVSGALAALMLRVLRRAGPTTTIAYAPYISAAAIATILST